jgi:hypothetical protein
VSLVWLEFSRWLDWLHIVIGSFLNTAV